MKQRSGISANISEKIALRALQHGIKDSDTTGPLKEWVDEKLHGPKYHIYLYAGMAYIFKKETLITVLRIPDELNTHLETYVEENTWKEYAGYRKSLQRKKEDHDSGDEKNTVIDIHTIRALVNRYFQEHGIPFVATAVSRNHGRTYTIHYTSKDPDNDGRYMRQIREWGEKSRGIKLELQRNSIGR